MANSSYQILEALIYNVLSQDLTLLTQLFDQVSLLQAKLPQIILQLDRFLTVYSGELSSMIGVDLDKAALIISVSGFEPAISEPVSTDRLRSSWRYG